MTSTRPSLFHPAVRTSSIVAGALGALVMVVITALYLLGALTPIVLIVGMLILVPVSFWLLVAQIRSAAFCDLDRALDGFAERQRAYHAEHGIFSSSPRLDLAVAGLERRYHCVLAVVEVSDDKQRAHLLARRATAVRDRVLTAADGEAHTGGSCGQDSSGR